ncbi:MAG: hypothetical protein IJY23_03970 [Clostridia bacterium]|nr:hypothetical protein [Clostridia bacterium]
MARNRNIPPYLHIHQYAPGYAEQAAESYSKNLSYSQLGSDIHGGYSLSGSHLFPTLCKHFAHATVFVIAF